MVTHEAYRTLTSSILIFVVLRYCFELRRRFTVSFRRCFENFEITSKLDGGSPSHFDTVSTFMHSRYCFDLRRWLTVSFRLCFENFDFTSKFEGDSPSHFDAVSTFIHSRYCFELRRRFAVLFHHCFENFDFTSKFEDGSPLHFDALPTFIHVVGLASNCDGDSSSHFATVSKISISLRNSKATHHRISTLFRLFFVCNKNQ